MVSNTQLQTGKTNFNIAIVLLMFLVVAPMISAYNWDNVYSVSGDNNELVTIENAFGFGRDLAYMNLTWGNTRVPRGSDRHVGTFTIEFTDDNANDIFSNMNLVNMRNGQTMSRGMQYKVKTYKNISVDDYETVCNGTYWYDEWIEDYRDTCWEVEIGSHWEIQEEWTPLSNPAISFTAGEIYEIGIFVDVEKGDYGDWKPRLMGVTINEWATYIEDLNPIHHYNMDEASGPIIDSEGVMNLTNTGCTAGATGILNDGYNCPEDINDAIVGFSDDFMDVESFSVSQWIYNDGQESSNYIFDYQGNTNDDPQISWYHLSNESLMWGGYDTSWQFQIYTPAIATGTWTHVVSIYEDNNASFYVNGSLVGTDTSCDISRGSVMGRIAIASSERNNGLGWDGIVDHITFFNRTISESEVTDLYNSGAGMYYSLQNNAPTVTNIAPTNDTTYTATNNVTIQFNVTDDKEVDNITVTFNGASNYTNSSGVNGTYSYTYYELADGYYNWSVTGVDNESSSTTGDVWYFNISTIDPIVTPLYPADNQNFTSASVKINGTVTDNSGVSSVTLWINGVLNDTDTGGVNGTYAWTQDYADGSYVWSIGGEDEFGNTANSTNRTFNVDTSAPVPTVTDKNFTYAEMLTDNQIINYTYVELNPDSCWYDYNGTNVSISSCTDLGFLINLTIGNNNITVYMNDSFGNLGSDFMSWSVTSTPINFIVQDYTGANISSVQFGGDISGTGNPYSDYMSNYINSTNKTINITVNVLDLTYYNQDQNFTVNINSSTTEYVLTLASNKLVLTFLNGTVTNSTKFEIFDGDVLIANETSSMVVVQGTLSSGPIYVRFNEDAFGANWTQFYEYINNYKTHITENLTLIDDADWTIYFTVKSKDNTIIENAVLRAETAGPTNNSQVNVSLIGQRLTQPDGTTFFLFDSSTYATITVTATGYDAKEVLLTVGDESADTKSTSYTIYLDDSESGIDHNVWINYPKNILSKSSNIEGMIMAKSADLVKISTDYRSDNGLLPRELTSYTSLWDLIGRGKYNATLISGTDFSASTTDDVVVYVYIDGVNAYNWTIEYTAPTRILDIPSTLNDNVVVVASSIALIFIAGAVGMLFTSTTAGFTAFMVGSIFLGLINTSFLWLSIVSMLYFALKLVSRVIKE